jgi:predicted nucleic acid-binding protein
VSTIAAPAAPRATSEALSSLRDLFAAYPWVAEIFTVFQVRLVVDANIVLSDLRWLVTKRRSPEARTTLQEVIAAGTVVAYAPSFLDVEVRTHLPRLAEDGAVPLERFESAWAEYRASLHFFAVADVVYADAPDGVGDPKDLPYVHLRSLIGAAAVYSRDKHVEAMGAPVVKQAYLDDLRTYSRAAPVSLTIMVGGSAVVVTSAATTRAVLVHVYGLLKKVGDLPRSLQIAIAMVAMVALVHPTSRAWLARMLRALPARLQGAFGALSPVLGSVVGHAVEAHEEARTALARARTRLPGSARYRLATHLLAVCVAAGRPMTIPEIERALRKAGCKAKSKHLRRYLSRALQDDSRFASSGGGRWVVAAGHDAPATAVAASDSPPPSPAAPAPVRPDQARSVDDPRVLSWIDLVGWREPVLEALCDLVPRTASAQGFRARDLRESEVETALCQRLPDLFHSVRAYHAASPENVASYYAHGLRTLDCVEWDGWIRAFYLDGSFPELTADDVDGAIAELHSEQRQGALFLALDDRPFVHQAGHYLIYGSEYVMAVAAGLTRRKGRDYRRCLRGVGTPTVFACDVPISLLPGREVRYLCSTLIEGLIGHRRRRKGPAREVDHTIELRDPIPAPCVRGHYHPDEVIDYHDRGLQVRYAEHDTSPKTAPLLRS